MYLFPIILNEFKRITLKSTSSQIHSSQPLANFIHLYTIMATISFLMQLTTQLLFVPILNPKFGQSKTNSKLRYYIIILIKQVKKEKRKIEEGQAIDHFQEQEKTKGTKRKRCGMVTKHNLRTHPILPPEIFFWWGQMFKLKVNQLLDEQSLQAKDRHVCMSLVLREDMDVSECTSRIFCKTEISSQIRIGSNVQLLISLA